MAYIVVLYDLSPFLERHENFFRFITSRIARGAGISFSELLDYLPIKMESMSDRDVLLHRGEFTVNDGVWTNHKTNKDRINFRDDTLGLISVDLPNDIFLNVSQTTESITFLSQGGILLVTEVQNIQSFSNLSVAAPFSVSQIVIGSRHINVSLTDVNTNSISIDGKDRSISSLATDNTGMSEMCEKDWILLQDKSSGRCLVQRNTNPIRRFTYMGDFDSKEEALQAASGCNGVTVVD